MYRIKIAETDTEIQGALALAHKVFISQENHNHYLTSDSEPYVYDLYDTLHNNNKLVIAVCDEKVVGSVRVTLNNPTGMPCEELFDFTQYVRPIDYVNCAAAGRFCIDRAMRGSAGIARALGEFSLHWALSSGANVMIIAINPQVKSFMRRLGFACLADEMLDEKKHVPFVPMMMDLHCNKAPFRRFHQMIRNAKFFDALNYYFFLENEVIYRQGDQRKTAYVLLSGEVELESSEHIIQRATATDGAIIGGMALLNPEQAHRFKATCSKQSVLIGIDYCKLQEIFAQDHLFGLDVLQQLSEAIEKHEIKDTIVKTII